MSAQLRITPVILAGGAGERLWPLSKADYPKQFTALDHAELSLFQQTVQRVADRAQFAAPIVVCNHLHRFIVTEQLRAIACDDAVLIVEPVARNTAPALALAAFHCEDTHPGSLLLVLPADHRIEQKNAFLAAIQTSITTATDGWFVTFAMTPDAPETGYGYIQIGDAIWPDSPLHRIATFREKPDRATAESYLAQGGYGWNSGIFLLHSTAFLKELAQHDPVMHQACHAAYRGHRLDQSFLRPEAEAMQHCPSNSIDYALMERTTRGAVLPLSMGWSDLGSWTALADLHPKDSNGNALSGTTLLEDTQDCYIRSHHPLIATIGLRDMVVVAADHAILVGPKNRMQDIKQLLQQLRSKFLPDLNLMSFANRPWGSFFSIDRGPRYQVKKLHVKPGGKISLQSHAHRSEHWIVVEGRATVTNGDRVTMLEENQSTYIPAGVTHRLENHEARDLIVIEVQTGEYLGEDDIQRLEDVYNRECV